MTPLDRVAAFAYLLGIPVTFYVAGMLFVQGWMQRPTVTRHPFTGELYIPRSDLYITGRYTRRHG
jgi:hypothetical protein